MCAVHVAAVFGTVVVSHEGSFQLDTYTGHVQDTAQCLRLCSHSSIDSPRAEAKVSAGPMALKF